MAVWAVIHSLLVGTRPRVWFRNQFGEHAFHGWYRFVYNVIAAVTLLPTSFLFVAFPDGVLWEIPSTFMPVLFVIQVIGFIGFAASLLQVDLLRFLGLRQAWAYLTDGPLPLPPERMQYGGVFRLVRHPLYLFSLMLIWSVPVMSGAYFGFCLGVTAYFVLGSLVEEQRLVQSQGESYLRYRQQVPWLLPLPRPRASDEVL